VGLLLLQVPKSCETTDAATGAVTNNCQQVYMTADQMRQIAELSQGNTHYLAGWLAIALLCLGAMVMIMAIGGR